MVFVPTRYVANPPDPALHNGRPAFGRVIDPLAQNANYLEGWQFLRLVEHVEEHVFTGLEGHLGVAAQTVRMRWTTSPIATNLLIAFTYFAEDPLTGAPTAQVDATVSDFPGPAVTDLGCRWSVENGHLPSNSSRGAVRARAFSGGATRGSPRSVYTPFDNVQTPAMVTAITTPRPLNVSASQDMMLELVTTDATIYTVSALEMYQDTI